MATALAITSSAIATGSYTPDAAPRITKAGGTRREIREERALHSGRHRSHSQLFGLPAGMTRFRRSPECCFARQAELVSRQLGLDSVASYEDARDRVADNEPPALAIGAIIGSPVAGILLGSAWSAVTCQASESCSTLEPNAAVVAIATLLGWLITGIYLLNERSNEARRRLQEASLQSSAAVTATMDSPRGPLHTPSRVAADDASRIQRCQWCQKKNRLPVDRGDAVVKCGSCGKPI
jgi:hypothetical protein